MADVSQQELLYRERLLDLTDDIYAQLKAMSGRLPRADMRPLTGEPTRPGQSHALVFLDAEPSYQPLASQIREAFGDRVAWFDPLSEGTAEEIRQDLEQNLIECDALILIYGDNLSWARTQFRLLRKLEHLRDRPLRTISVIDVPAPAKQPLGVHGFPTVLIDTRDGITQTVIGQLAKCLEL